MTWRTAFLRQADSDYQIFKLLTKTPHVSLNHKLHYLQMATEKLSKGLQISSTGSSYDRTHQSFLPFVRQIAFTTPGLRTACGIVNRDQYRAYLRGLEPLAEALSTLAPRSDTFPNPEYPWEQLVHQEPVVFSPLDYGFPGLELFSPGMIRLIRFLDACFELIQKEIS